MLLDLDHSVTNENLFNVGMYSCVMHNIFQVLDIKHMTLKMISWLQSKTSGVNSFHKYKDIYELNGNIAHL